MWSFLSQVPIDINTGIKRDEALELAEKLNFVGNLREEVFWQHSSFIRFSGRTRSKSLSFICHLYNPHNSNVDVQIIRFYEVLRQTQKRELCFYRLPFKSRGFTSCSLQEMRLKWKSILLVKRSMAEVQLWPIASKILLLRSTHVLQCYSETPFSWAELTLCTYVLTGDGYSFVHLSARVDDECSI